MTKSNSSTTQNILKLIVKRYHLYLNNSTTLNLEEILWKSGADPGFYCRRGKIIYRKILYILKGAIGIILCIYSKICNKCIKGKE